MCRQYSWWSRWGGRGRVGRDHRVPALSTATHNDVEGHDTAETPCPASMFSGALQVGVAAVGSVVTNTHPTPTATHNDSEGHETPDSVAASVADCTCPITPWCEHKRLTPLVP